MSLPEDDPYDLVNPDLLAEIESLRAQLAATLADRLGPRLACIGSGVRAMEGETKLLPCPYCGHKTDPLSYADSPTRGVRFICENCLAQGPPSEDGMGWNRRAEPVVPDAVVDLLISQPLESGWFAYAIERNENCGPRTYFIGVFPSQEEAREAGRKALEPGIQHDAPAQGDCNGH